MRFDTQLIHAGYTPDPVTHSRAVPLYMTSAYAFDDTEHARRLFALEQNGDAYSRISSPTCNILEARVAALEGGAAAVAAASGHAADVMAILALMRQGDELVSARAIYGGQVNLFQNTLSMMGIQTVFVDGDDPDAFARATNDHTKAWFIENISNPRAIIPDIAAIAKLAKARGVPLIVDNTVATPYLCRPIELGADIVVHSLSKYMSGSGTVIGGIVVDSGRFPFLGNPRFPAYNSPDPSYHGLKYGELATPFTAKLRAHILRDVGACLSPFNAWVTLLGLETLSLRMDRHCANALAVAEFLDAHPAVEAVDYPLLPGSPYRALAMKQCPKGVSSCFAFTLGGGREAARVFCDSVKLASIVTNLGDSRTLVNCPSLTTHAQLTDAQLKTAGIGPGMVRISVGLEDKDDLIEDIAQALAGV
jgi:O-acetylhomoserine (thiol)-lyase